MRKIQKLVGYLILLAIPVAIAAALFVFNGSGYRLSEQQSQNHVLDSMEVMRLVSQRRTIVLSIRLTVCQGLF